MKGVKSDVRNITKLEVSKPAKRNPVLSVKPLSLAVTPGTGHNSTLSPARLPLVFQPSRCYPLTWSGHFAEAKVEIGG